LVFEAIDSVEQKSAADCDLLKSLISVHIAYDSVKAHIQQFHQLVSLESEIVDVVRSKISYPTNEMVCMII